MSSLSSDRHSFRFQWGSFEVVAVSWRAVVTVLVGIMALVGLRLYGFILKNLKIDQRLDRIAEFGPCPVAPSALSRIPELPTASSHHENCYLCGKALCDLIDRDHNPARTFRIGNSQEDQGH